MPKFSQISALLPITLQAPYWNKRPLPFRSAFLNTDISIKDSLSLPFYCYIQYFLPVLYKEILFRIAHDNQLT